MTCLSAVNGGQLKYTHMIGTGGIGSGIFFKLDGNHTLGRNESRSGILEPYRDYCKLHIISHYIAVLLKAGSESGFNVYPIGKVGMDDVGRNLIKEMENAGMSIRYISTVMDARTLFSVCFQYPDSTGGNITTSNSASSRITSQDIDDFFKSIEPCSKRELILAVPEVPVKTRVRLLEYGRCRGSLNVSSLLSSEVEEFKDLGGFELSDLISINIDEATAISGYTGKIALTEKIVRSCIDVLAAANPRILLTITDGPNCSYCWENGYLERIPPLKTTAVGTGGAGDAFLSGTITGLCCGLPFTKGRNDGYFSETPLQSAVELGTLLASLSVNSTDTIHPNADAEMLFKYAQKNKVQFSQLFKDLFTRVNTTD